MIPARSDSLRVAFVIGSLGPGGAERVITILANAFAQHGWHTLIITLVHAERQFYPLDPRVRSISLLRLNGRRNVLAKIANGLAALKKIRRTVQLNRSDVVVSFLTETNVLAILALAGTGVPVVVSERTDPLLHKLPWVWRLLRRCSYRASAALVIQTEALREWAKRLVPDSRISVIPNPIPSRAFVTQSADSSLPQVFISAMGRLVYVKGFDILIEAYSTIAARYPHIKLVILGEGPDREQLRDIAAKFRVSDSVHLLGHRTDPFSVLGRALLFVQSSRYEGFPNALAEAMSIGLPVVASDCSHGLRAIIAHEENGLLVPPDDAGALACAMLRLIENDSLRGRIAANGKRSVESLDTPLIATKWKDLISLLLVSTEAARRESE